MEPMSGLQIGTVSDSTRPLPEQIREAVDIGFDFLEIVVMGHHADLVAIRAQWDELANCPPLLNLFFHLPWTLDLGSPMEPCRVGSVKALQEILETGRELNIKKATVHPSSRSYCYWNRNLIDGKILTSLKELRYTAQQAQIELVAENESDFTLRNFHTIINETEVNMCLDTGHAVLHGSDEDEIVRFVRDNKDRITHVHLNDNRRGRDEHLPLSYGFIDLQRIVGTLQELDWTGSLAIELHTHNPDYLRLSRDTLNAWLNENRGA